MVSYGCFAFLQFASREYESTAWPVDRYQYPFGARILFRIRFTNNSMSLYNDLVMVGAFRFALPTVNELDWVSDIWL